MKTIERLAQYLDFKRINLTQFDKSIGAGTGYIGKQIKRNASIGSDVLEKIVSFYSDLDAAWLVTGVGEMIKSTSFGAQTPARISAGARPLYPYSAHTPDHKRSLTARSKAKTAPPTAPPNASFSPKVVTMADSQSANIAFVPVRAQAGYLNGYGDPEYFENLQTFRLPGLNNGAFRAFELQGDSMAPTLKNREVVIAEYIYNFNEITNDHPHVILTKNDGIVIKRLINSVEQYGYLIAKSDANDKNNDYPDFEIYPDEVLEIWRGVAHISRTFDHPGDTDKRLTNVEASIHELFNRLQKQD